MTAFAWSDDALRKHGLAPSPARVPIPDAPQSVAEVLGPALARNPDAVALVGRSGRLTFRALDAAANAAAAFLAEQGLKLADRIAVSAPNDLDIVVAFLAVQRLGGVWVGVNRALSASEKRYVLQDCGASLYVGDRISAEQVREGAIECPALRSVIDLAADDPSSTWATGLKRHAGASAPNVSIDPWAPAAIAYTSGTTGFPKGAVHSQHNIMLAATMTEVMAVDRRDGVIRGTVSPLTILNIMIGGPIATLSRGLRQVCMDRIDAQGIAEWVKAEQINTLILVPATVHDLLTRADISRDDLASLTWIVAGAATVPAHLPALYRERFGHAMTVGYGLTEQPTAVSRTHDKTPVKQGAIGRPLPHIDVAILDDAGRRLPAEEAGEICVRPAATGRWANVYTPTLGYWGRPEATAHLLRDGWMHTGDIGALDEEGELFIHDRRSELINRGGANIYPAEVERVLRLDARVVDCAVVGKPDERLGHVVAAFIEAQAGVDGDALVRDLAALCAREMAKYKTPATWAVVDKLPRNAMGKIAKAKLRARLEDAS